MEGTLAVITSYPNYSAETPPLTSLTSSHLSHGKMSESYGDLRMASVADSQQYEDLSVPSSPTAKPDSPTSPPPVSDAFLVEDPPSFIRFSELKNFQPSPSPSAPEEEPEKERPQSSSSTGNSFIYYFPKFLS
jgi:hypothetical protein